MANIFLIFLSLTCISFSNVENENLRWVKLPIENSENIFNQCSREAPSYKKIIILDDSIYQNAIKLLESKHNIINRQTKLNIYDYTIQLVGFKYKSKSYIYFNACYTDLETEKELKWTEYPMIWCDGGSIAWGLVYNIEENELINFHTNGLSITKINKL